jgi:hypothetical protein
MVDDNGEHGRKSRKFKLIFKKRQEYGTFAFLFFHLIPNILASRCGRIKTRSGYANRDVQEKRNPFCV